MIRKGEPSLDLPASPPRRRDVGTNAVRLPRRAFRVLGIEEGDPLCVEGARARLWVRALHAHDEDEGIDVARIDVTEEECPEVGHGGTVRIRPAPVRPARVVEVAVAHPDDASVHEIREALAEGAVLLGGDRIRVELEDDTRGFDVGLSVVGVSLLRVAGRGGRLDGTVARVVATVPEGPVRLVADTEIRVIDDAEADDRRAADGADRSGRESH